MAQTRWTVMFAFGAATALGLGSCTEGRTAPPESAGSEAPAEQPRPVAEPAETETAPGDPLAAESPTPAPPTAADPAQPDLGAGAGAGLATPVAPAVSEPRTYSVVGVGDIMMGSDWPQPGMDPRITPEADPAVVMGDQLAGVFADADIVFGNYEGTIHSSDIGAKQCGNPEYCYVFRSPPFHADYLRRAGFTLMSNANNHARDFGEPGRMATYATLIRAGIAVAGGDVEGMRIAVQEADDGRRFALVAFGHNPGLLSVQNYSRVAEMVRAADARADVVIVSCHIGAEGASHFRVTRQTETYLNEDRGNPYRFAHAAIDAGADIVFCHGPHIPRAIEVYNGRFIAYSLGNFWTYGRFNLRGHNGLAPVARLEVDGEGALVAAEIVSARQDRPGGPRLDASGAAAARIAELTALDFAASGVRVDAAGRVSWPGQAEVQPVAPAETLSPAEPAPQPEL
ncbi:MAG: CapA family protein [Sphingomonadaceae bacterium]|nr:CapA family protein [Sphingomonadaceae bacterium]